MIDNNTKAKRMAEALEAVADEERFRGDPNTADLLLKARNELPVGSLVKLYDIFEKCVTKQEALETLGAGR